MTECNQKVFSFTAHFSRRVEAGFSAGQVSSDGGALLLRETERKINLLGRLAGCFMDGRDPERIEPLPIITSLSRTMGLRRKPTQTSCAATNNIHTTRSQVQNCEACDRSVPSKNKYPTHPPGKWPHLATIRRNGKDDNQLVFNNLPDHPVMRAVAETVKKAHEITAF